MVSINFTPAPLNFSSLPLIVIDEKNINDKKINTFFTIDTRILVTFFPLNQ
ncbi:hypothetical protein GCM10007877_40000 [Marinibactrum halimedae]|uniref:Uncharacterized protein n=1 Tax=Marinibactrum halimedae TaxID=1444977 RepID=A0AA37WQM6_9GAMM|nr:hypothetical protein GCM10007877_40000 [Marinibactrum halimedae]